MSTDLSAKYVAAARRLNSIAKNECAPERARLYLRKTQLGTWAVREANDRGGGLFATQEAARKFIRSEFGADAQIVLASVVKKKAA